MFGPTHIVAVLGFFLSLILFAVAIWQQDGMALLADICLSILSTLIGVGNKWTLNLPKRTQAPNVWTPPGDVVIRYPKGSFLVVSCSEDIARELYFAPEGLKYFIARPWKYRMISLVGTIMLMFGVIFLGNASIYLQIAFAASYMVLNAAYWIVAALPQKTHWDMSCFEVLPQAFDEPPPPMLVEEEEDERDQKGTGILAGGPKKPKRMDSMPKKPKPYVSYNETFTKALWKVIVATRDIDWIMRSQAAPHTPAWNAWLHDALHKANSMPQPTERGVNNIKTFTVPSDWDAQEELSKSIKHFKDDVEKVKSRASTPAPPLVVPPPDAGPVTVSL
jgi:hypothetical protein